MQGGSSRDWLMRDSTIVTLAFLGVCVVALLCLTFMVSCGRDGALIKSFIGIAVAVFGGNLYALIKSRK